MATQYANGQIVTNGLVLLFDAADRNSYPGSGTTWRDLGTNRTATINGTYSFTSDNGGYLAGFENNSTQIVVNNPPTTAIGSATLQSFFMYTQNQSEQTGPLNFVGASDGVRLGTGFNGLNEIGIYSNNRFIGTTTPLNTWTFASGVRNASDFTVSISLNGSSRTTNTYASLPTVTPTSLSIGWRGPSTVTTTIGRIAVCLYYDRALSVAEELQNYNVLRQRFGL